MCGRFERHSTLAEFSEVIEGLVADGPDLLRPSYNIAPSQQALIVRATSGTHTATALQWGLAPAWVKDPKMTRPINARAETVHERPMFRGPFRHQRCLVLCDGYYEWQKQPGGRKQPYYLGLADNTPFVLAGLWSLNTQLTGEALETFCIVTTEATAAASEIHARMPVVLPRPVHSDWLDSAVSDTDMVRELMAGHQADLRSYPVSTFVNSPANNSADCVVPLAEHQSAS
jgi:putative SOS response-associated peptidase YedK